MGLVTLLSFMACIALQCNCFGIERRSTLALLDNDNLNSKFFFSLKLSKMYCQRDDLFPIENNCLR